MPLPGGHPRDPAAAERIGGRENLTPGLPGSPERLPPVTARFTDGVRGAGGHGNQSNTLMFESRCSVALKEGLQ